MGKKNYKINNWEKNSLNIVLKSNMFENCKFYSNKPINKYYSYFHLLG